jgi:tellurite resistance protein
MKYTDKVTGLKAKAKALEDSFFAKENERILQELRAATAREEKKQEFREYLNIDNDEVLDALVELAVEPETLVAFTLVPLVEVAWADGEIQPKERDAILKAAIERGVEVDSPTAALLTNWLQNRPGPQLLETWRGYMEELSASLGDRTRAHMKSSVMGRARAVAEAAGGFLGVASISAAEKKKLEELEWTFD